MTQSRNPFVNQVYSSLTFRLEQSSLLDKVVIPS